MVERDKSRDDKMTNLTNEEIDEIVVRLSKCVINQPDLGDLLDEVTKTMILLVGPDRYTEIQQNINSEIDEQIRRYPARLLTAKEISETTLEILNKHLGSIKLSSTDLRS